LQRSRVRDIVLFGVGALVLVLDQVTKSWARSTLPLHRSWNPIPWLNKIMTLTYTRNTGAAFGMFQNMNSVFIGVAIVVILAIIFYFRRYADASWMLMVAFGLHIGGAAGNMVDRLTLGFVTDFIDFRVWPIFNVADSSVVVGTAMLAYYTLFVDRPDEDEQGVSERQQDAEVVET